MRTRISAYCMISTWMDGVIIKRGTGNEKMGNGEMWKRGNEEMNWKWSTIGMRYIRATILAITVQDLCMTGKFCTAT